MKTNKIIISNINLGGLADSIFQGVENSVAALVGFNIHEEPGILKVNQALTKKSGTLIDDLVKAIVPCSDGNTYLFGSTNGKIWQRTSAGVYSLLATASPAIGGAGIVSAYEYQGYIYYAMQNRLGRVAVGAPTNWAGRNDSWATFSNGNATLHPMEEQNMVLYIGDGNYVAQVDAGVFTADALDIKTPLIVSSLGKILTDLLVGTFVNIYKVATEIMRWNTWSVSFSSLDDLPEIGINAFLKTDNFNLVSAGRKGNLYLYNGSSLEQYKRIIGDWSTGKEAIINNNAVCNKNGLPLFGLSNSANNPALQGVYSFGSYANNYPKVLNLEYVLSNGHTSNIEIGCTELVGDVLIVSWKDTTSGTVYGVDELDSTLKQSSAYFETRVININRSELKDFKAMIGYRTLPTGTSVKLYYKVNYASSWTEVTDLTTDIDRKIITAESSLPECTAIQFKVQVLSTVNNAPELDYPLELTLN